MNKRKAPPSNIGDAPGLGRKRQRTTSLDRLSPLSDETLLRIFSNVCVSDLAVCHRLSQRLRTIASDSQIWRNAYYDRFVRPRFNRLPKTRRSPHPSKLARWLDESSLVQRGRTINWKRQYKLRHKWSQGLCDVSEIPVAARPSVPPLLARLHEGIVYTVETLAGLRAWSYKGARRVLASISLQALAMEGGQESSPTSFAVDTSSPRSGMQRLIVGFDDGRYSIYDYSVSDPSFLHRYTHPPSSNGRLTALAIASPYIATMSERQILSLYRTAPIPESGPLFRSQDPPLLLSSLNSHTVWPPLSLSLRITDGQVKAAIAYCMPTFNSGWSVGVQELQVSPDGEVLESRLASAAGQGFSSVNPSIAGPSRAVPTSLSYSHPYLLVSHAENTLTLYMVSSTASSLTVNAGKRLWGHTSAVFGAHVGGRGKAVSVSTRGNEVRVWELEGSSLSKHDYDRSDLSVQVTPKKQPPRKHMAVLTGAMTQRSLSGCSMDAHYTDDADITRGWVGFDDESVVVLRERDHGQQALAVYDFS